jgi:hypothetical protein
MGIPYEDVYVRALLAALIGAMFSFMTHQAAKRSAITAIVAGDTATGRKTANVIAVRRGRRCMST